MKHAGAQALESLHIVLQQLRGLEMLVERSSGVFYLKSKAFLHFHEDPAGLFADLRLDGNEFQRLRVTTRDEQERLVALVRQHIS